MKHVCLVLIVILSLSGFSQSNKKLGKLLLSGKVVNEKKKGLESKIRIYRSTEFIDELETSRIGKFQFEVDLNDSIAFVVMAENYVSKTVFVDTKVNDRKKHQSFVFPFFIDLYPVGRIPSHEDLERPVGKIRFSGTQFIYDLDFTKKANLRLKEFVKERKNPKVRRVNYD